MPRFTLSRLLCSFVLIAVGAGEIAYCVSVFWNCPPPEPDNAILRVMLGIIQLSLALLAGTLLGAGVGNLWSRPKRGAIIGTVLWIGFLIVCFIYGLSTLGG